MGRIRPAWEYEKLAGERKRREDYLKNKPRSTNAVVQGRKEVTRFYRSALLKTGTEHDLFRIRVDEAALNLLGAGRVPSLGLLENAPAGPAGQVPQRLRGSGLKPSRLHWYKGTTTPAATTTPWGTRVLRYYDKQGQRSHYSAPVSKATGAFTLADIVSAFNTITATDPATLLGAENGRAWLDLETVAIATSS
jgi:hypothetical protein